MCDFDDFDGEFEGDGFMDDDFEDTYGEHLGDYEPEETLIEDDPVRDEPDCERVTGRDAFILGGAMGFAYEMGLEEAERRRLEKEMDSKRSRRKRNAQ